MLSVANKPMMLSVIMLNVVMLSVVTLSAVAPYKVIFSEQFQLKKMVECFTDTGEL
jgi:hypothetical protein